MRALLSLVLHQATTSRLSLGRGAGAQLRCVTSRMVAEFPHGQDLTEQFELYAAPDRADAVLPAGAAPRMLGQRKARGEVHRDGDWHRSVHVWLADNQGRLLLQQRSMEKDTNPGCWDVSCAGHITAGDDSLETAQRELEEEIGVKVELQALREAWLCTLPSQDVGNTEKHGSYICREFQDVYLLRSSSLTLDELTLGTGEVSAVKWLPGEEVLVAWKTADATYVRRDPHYQQVIADALKNDRQHKLG
ncbi:hypothetical protein AB1Y20_009399 [Prymnesium parvum]|uniref:Nudix hydrolase domain-containing protein n=1 Tax=Prymnesium parvum TaxID=97485 RepID=A0AB34K1I1_PRYPA